MVFSSSSFMVGLFSVLSLKHPLFLEGLMASRLLNGNICITRYYLKCDGIKCNTSPAWVLPDYTVWERRKCVKSLFLDSSTDWMWRLAEDQLDAFNRAQRNHSADHDGTRNGVLNY